MKEQDFELKLSNGKTVEWPGKDGINACERYADTYPGIVVVAWRPITYGIFLYNPGDTIK